MRALALFSIAAIAGCTSVDCDEPGTICTVMGASHARSEEIDLAPAAPLDVVLSLPSDLAVDPATGALYVIDFNAYVIRALEDGVVRVIAGTGELGQLGDGPAAQPLNHLGDLLLDGDGGLLIAGWHSSVVARLDLAAATVTRIAGTGTRTKYTGDGGPALEAALDLPAGLALAPDGRLLVTDEGNQVIRALDRTTGTIERFAGQCIADDSMPCDAPIACPNSDKRACTIDQCAAPCSPGFAGDGAALGDVRFAFPYGSQAIPAGKPAVGPDGTVYIADCDNHRIRALRRDGTAATFAGGGTWIDDGAPASASQLGDPVDVAVASDGTVYLADLRESCVRAVDPAGVIRTVAGICGETGFSGDGGRATEARVYRPLGIALDERARKLYIADTYNHRIRSVAL